MFAIATPVAVFAFACLTFDGWEFAGRFSWWIPPPPFVAWPAHSSTTSASLLSFWTTGWFLGDDSDRSRLPNSLLSPTLFSRPFVVICTGYQSETWEKVRVMLEVTTYRTRDAELCLFPSWMILQMSASFTYYKNFGLRGNLIMSVWRVPQSFWESLSFPL